MSNRISKRPALIIIDMQYDFASSRSSKTISSIKKEIAKSKAKKEFIIIVEYQDYGKTIPSIMKEVKGYPYLFVINKMCDNGANEIIQLIVQKQIPVTRYKICGVNSSYCVYETIRGLLPFIGKIPLIILADSCNCTKSKEYVLNLYNDMTEFGFKNNIKIEGSF